MHLLPHDAAVKELGSGRSRTETLASMGLFPYRVLRAHSVADGINAVRMVLPRAWFDAEKCAQGIKALRNYRREWNAAGETWRVNPRHDWSSHCADSMRYMCIATRETLAPAAEERVRDSWERAWSRANQQEVADWRVA